MAKNNKPVDSEEKEAVIEAAPEASTPEKVQVKEAASVEVELKAGQCVCHPPGKPDKQMVIPIANYNSTYKGAGWVLLAEKKR